MRALASKRSEEQQGPRVGPPKDGRGYKALVAGGKADFVQKSIAPRLSSTFGIAVKKHLDYEHEKTWGSVGISDVDVVILLQDMMNHAKADRLVAKCKAEGVPFVRAVRKWSTLQEQVERAGFRAPSAPPIIPDRLLASAGGAPLKVRPFENLRLREKTSEQEDKELKELERELAELEREEAAQKEREAAVEKAREAQALSEVVKMVASGAAPAARSGIPQLVMVGPEFAKALLDRNQHNRTMSPSRVSFYARQMVARGWRVSNTSIAIGRDGTLYDGQHRLAAVVEANVTVPMLISWHDADDRKAFNQGKPDGVGGVLERLYGETYGNQKAAAITKMLRLWGKKFSRGALSPDETHRFLTIHREAIERAITISHRGPFKYRRSTIVGAAAFSSYLGGEKAFEFLEQVCLGEGIKRGMPAYTFRERVYDARTDEGIRSDRRLALKGEMSSNSDVMAEKYLSACHAHVRGETSQKLIRENPAATTAFRAAFEAADKRLSAKLAP